MSRILVIGLDGFSPELAEAWLPELPNLRGLMERGIHGPLQSIVQPITPAAWTAMISGRDPGHFGFTDFTVRVGSSYTDFKLVHSRMIRVPNLYTILPNAGKRVLMVGVPITYPPVSISGGACISCFMAPSATSNFTQPPELQAEIMAQTSSPYLVDVSVGDHEEGVDRDDLLRRIREMDRQRFDTVRYLMQAKPWDLLFAVCMGTDRIGHYFMRFQDPAHGRYDPDPRYHNAMQEHYKYCDQRIGELLALAGPDTVVMVVSDHGMQRMDGKVNLNDWLVANRYLTLTGPVQAPTPLSKAPVDWSSTQAWARGYGGQIYLNIRGREPQGCLEPAQADALLDELAERLKQVVGPDGKPLRAETFRRRDIYSGPHAESCPDLFVQFESCRFLTSDQVGHRRLVTPIAELGFDDGAHAPAGFFAMAGPGISAQGRFAALHLLDIAPTILDLMGIPVSADLEGRPIHKAGDVYSPEEEEELTNRLRALYLE